MTRRDFELIARAVRSAAVVGRVGFVARPLADALASTNPRFDRGRFLEACGVPPDGN
jgi:hypothetical protein